MRLDHHSSEPSRTKIVLWAVVFAVLAVLFAVATGGDATQDPLSAVLASVFAVSALGLGVAACLSSE